MPEQNEPEKRPERGDERYRQELEELQKVDFALVELSLYLDTHPNDIQAIQQFNQLAHKRAQLAHAFELRYGPLMQFGHSFTRYPWQWKDTPWPWQV
ncbi:spore coat protein CotJB [Cohnella laeviribosi]|jgi:spore coat protein JB|uniref:spore coat protein CotJB n=1 Tax=Cohnella laeviribosi TaxID=380174 RepID=UPI00035F0E0A|nr:spore coat protein CotJB [Cohnella laeviribosi]